MIDFSKVSEDSFIIKEYYYLLVRKYKYACTEGAAVDAESILEAFMNTRFFLWMEEYRDCVKVTIESDDVITDWNFHGFYDVQKLTVQCFDKVNFDELYKRISNYIYDFIEDKEYNEKTHQTLQKLKSKDKVYFIIKTLPKEYKHDWSVYDAFISGFVCDINAKTITLVECGTD